MMYVNFHFLFHSGSRFFLLESLQFGFLLGFRSAGSVVVPLEFLLHDGVASFRITLCEINVYDAVFRICLSVLFRYHLSGQIPLDQG